MLNLTIEIHTPSRPSLLAAAGLHFVLCSLGGLEDQWRLLIEECRGHGDDGVFEPLVNASRENRLLAMSQLPQFIEILLDTAEKEFIRVETMTSAALKIADGLAAAASQRAKAGAK